MNLIVAVDRNWAIGYQGGLLFRIPEDLKRFKALTLGHPVLMGRKTLESFPGRRPLPGRANWVLSRDPGFQPQGCVVYRDLDSLRADAPDDSFVIGGESVYRALLPWCDVAYVTKIDAAAPAADAFFPDLDADPVWRVAEEAPWMEFQGVRFRYVTYRRG